MRTIEYTHKSWYADEVLRLIKKVGLEDSRIQRVRIKDGDNIRTFDLMIMNYHKERENGKEIYLLRTNWVHPITLQLFEFFLEIGEDTTPEDVDAQIANWFYSSVRWHEELYQVDKLNRAEIYTTLLGIAMDANDTVNAIAYSKLLEALWQQGY